MKLVIASDIHGSSYYCKKLVSVVENEKPDRLVLLGDVLYHGPRNDLPKDYAPKEVIALFNEYKNDILAVRGNCDTEVDQMVLDFPILADYAFIECDGVRMFVTHGHKFNITNRPPRRSGDILLHGHTHVSGVTPFGDGNFYINPGSVSIPKENTPKGYILFDSAAEKKFTFKTLDGEQYMQF